MGRIGAREDEKERNHGTQRGLPRGSRGRAAGRCAALVRLSPPALRGSRRCRRTRPVRTRPGCTRPTRTRYVISIRRTGGDPVDPFTALAGAVSAAGVRYLVIGVWGANYYAPSGNAMFMTFDRDLFLPADPDNLLEAWRVCEANGFRLFTGSGSSERAGCSRCRAPRFESKARAGREKDRLFLATHREAAPAVRR